MPVLGFSVGKAILHQVKNLDGYRLLEALGRIKVKYPNTIIAEKTARPLPNHANPDPFGRTAEFQYDSTGHLHSNTDM